MIWNGGLWRILERGPLRPTRFGDGVLAAVEELAAFGGP